MHHAFHAESSDEQLRQLHSRYALATQLQSKVHLGHFRSLLCITPTVARQLSAFSSSRTEGARFYLIPFWHGTCVLI